MQNSIREVITRDFASGTPGDCCKALATSASRYAIRFLLRDGRLFGLQDAELRP